MNILASLALAPLALGGATANAAAIAVLSSPQVAAEVVGVDVGGDNYNVTFAHGAVDHTFDSMPGAAGGAAAQLETALNATTAPFVSSQGIGSISHFIVGNILAGGIQVASASVAGTWSDYGYAAEGSASVFTKIAQPTVLFERDKGIVVEEVKDLSVGGVLYNVTFAMHAVDHTFDGNPFEQAVAVAELENALNSNFWPYVLISGLHSNQFVVGNAFFGGTVLYSGSQSAGWMPITSSPDSVFTDAVFTRVTTAPESSTWAMMLLGFGGLGFAGYRRAKVVAAI